MSRISDLLNKLNEQTEILTKEKVNGIMNQILGEENQLEEDEELKENTIQTDYNQYKYYTLTYREFGLIPYGDYESYLSDIVSEFSNSLPDGFQRFFNEEQLKAAIKEDNSYLEQSIRFLNKLLDKDYYYYKLVDTDEVDGVNYTLIDEVIENE